MTGQTAEFIYIAVGIFILVGTAMHGVGDDPLENGMMAVFAAIFWPLLATVAIPFGVFYAVGIAGQWVNENLTDLPWKTSVRKIEPPIVDPYLKTAQQEIDDMLTKELV